MSMGGRFDSAREDPNIVLVNAGILEKAESCICSCEGCTPDLALVPFECLLDHVTNNDAEITEYVLIKSARCPRCAGVIRECSLVAVRGDVFDEDAVQFDDTEIFVFLGAIATWS
jgi:hypothetical protein